MSGNAYTWSEDGIQGLLVKNQKGDILYQKVLNVRDLSLLMSVQQESTGGQCVSHGQGIYAARSQYNITVIIKAEGYTEAEGCQLVETLLKDITLALLGSFSSVSGEGNIPALVKAIKYHGSTSERGEPGFSQSTVTADAPERP